MTRRRTLRLIEQAVERFALDLGGVTVLTEAATGPFATTAVIAAAGGADHVIAVTRDSPWGSVADSRTAVTELAEALGLSDRIHITDVPASELAAQADLVTNLGFVRPIDRPFIQRLPDGAVVTLMWEPWEHRPEDVDLAACAERGIPVLGTDERDPRVGTFDYLGVLAAKLLLEVGLEVERCRLAVVGSEPFGSIVRERLAAFGSSIVEPSHLAGSISRGEVDAVVLVEHRDRRPVLGPDAALQPRSLAAYGIPVVHIAGGVDVEAAAEAGLTVHPWPPAPAGSMTVTTGYLGPRPVVDLHAAGLRVGQALVEGMRLARNADEAVTYALAQSPAAGWET